jgi:hypothetical protein
MGARDMTRPLGQPVRAKHFSPNGSYELLGATPAETIDQLREEMSSDFRRKYGGQERSLVKRFVTVGY